MLNIHQLRSALFGPISLTVEAGECVAIRGPSGAGKSLFLRALVDLDPAQGTVTLDQVNRDAMPGWQWRTRVGFVPAQTGWWDDRVDAHFPMHQSRECERLFEELGLPGDALQWTVDRLSTGETQRLAIARALLLQPKVLLLDEPTASLDADATARVESLIARQQALGMMLVVVTHNADQAVRIAVRRYWLEAGRLHDRFPEDVA